jgi:hydrogenase/urease accessory protein HupE
VEHILGGIDHLMFVLGLILILTSWRQLAFAITAFTVAHSITLALATFRIISVRQPPVESVIALSIMFLATEYAHQLKGVKGWTSRRPWLVSFSVGLLHGLGFAKALSEVGLPQAEVPMALLTFNLGVEAGQLAFVGVVLAIFFIGSKMVRQVPSWTKAATSYALGSVAAFWFIQRTFLIFQ